MYLATLSAHSPYGTVHGVLIGRRVAKQMASNLRITLKKKGMGCGVNFQEGREHL